MSEFYSICVLLFFLLLVQVTENEKVSTVKELVFERLNIPPHQQRLLYKGKALAGMNKDYKESHLSTTLRSQVQKSCTLLLSSFL